MNSDTKYRYFIYSKYQHDMRVQVDKKINKVFSPGKVLVKGNWLPYTTLTSDRDAVNFPDAKIVIEGNIDEIKYQEPTSIWGAL